MWGACLLALATACTSRGGIDDEGFQAVRVSFLEHRVPPPIIAAVSAALMWVLARLSPDLTYRYPGRMWWAAALAIAGIAIMLAGVTAFAKAKTTVNPLQPAAATSIVTTGIYRWTRNPMYLGMLIVLIGWLQFLANPLALISVALFVLYIDRLQIRPEEHALKARFGSAYEAYLSDVRRWL